MKIYKTIGKDKKIKTQNKGILNWTWSFKILFLSLALSISFSIISEMALNGTSIFISILIIISFLIVNVAFDMVGVAITAGNISYFEELANRKMVGAKESLLLLRNADKVSVLCCDIIGDICGILSGACGASIVFKIIGESANKPVAMIISAVISGIIAGLTIFCKSIEKGYAVNKSEKIILIVGKFLKYLNFDFKSKGK
ncbi:MAG: hypothetical protein IJZ29_01395 [Clostridia bacterium]|nr:hypothetical protein [Clostridia bacterium]